MGGLRVLGCGYRSWALQIFAEIPGITILTSKEQIRLELFEEIDPEVVLFYGWSWRVPAEIVQNYECLCLHPSRLPQYRGGSPIQNQIMDGVARSSVSIFRMTDELYAGPLCFQAPLCLGEGNISDIYDRIARIGLAGTRQALFGSRIYTEQSGESSVYPRRKPYQSEITGDDMTLLSARQMHDKIRALTDPYPNAYIVCADGESLYLTGSRL